MILSLVIFLFHIWKQTHPVEAEQIPSAIFFFPKFPKEMISQVCNNADLELPVPASLFYFIIFFQDSTFCFSEKEEFPPIFSFYIYVFVLDTSVPFSLTWPRVAHQMFLLLLSCEILLGTIFTVAQSHVWTCLSNREAPEPHTYSVILDGKILNLEGSSRLGSGSVVSYCDVYAASFAAIADITKFFFQWYAF